MPSSECSNDQGATILMHPHAGRALVKNPNVRRLSKGIIDLNKERQKRTPRLHPQTQVYTSPSYKLGQLTERIAVVFDVNGERALAAARAATLELFGAPAHDESDIRRAVLS